MDPNHYENSNFQLEFSLLQQIRIGAEVGPIIDFVIEMVGSLYSSCSKVRPGDFPSSRKKTISIAAPEAACLGVTRWAVLGHSVVKVETGANKNSKAWIGGTMLALALASERLNDSGSALAPTKTINVHLPWQTNFG